MMGSGADGTAGVTSGSVIGSVSIEVSTCAQPEHEIGGLEDRRGDLNRHWARLFEFNLATESCSNDWSLSLHSRIHYRSKELFGKRVGLLGTWLHLVIVDERFVRRQPVVMDCGDLEEEAPKHAMIVKAKSSPSRVPRLD